jgi:Zn-dependent peptidase ImmA (M78 family)/O-acetyl-ADP-ribose deacetylase (regulator of RNase III)
MSGQSGTWTHPSARILLKQGPPVEVITDRARRLVCRALDLGWTGPPFDPLRLADILQIDVVASDEIQDARTIPLGTSRFRIEFNPSRPLARLRYSIAHEIAHTLFDDCGEDIRHRGRHSGKRSDEWQLEALCNVAAAELLMPVGKLPEEVVKAPRASSFPGLREEYGVSTEALLIRLARAATSPWAAFCASRIEDGPATGRYRLNYVMSNPLWRPRFHEHLLPKGTVVAECTAIGFTISGQELWAGEQPVLVEAVGIPPYPGSTYPRVAGMVGPAKGFAQTAETVPLRFANGDATQVGGQGARLLVHVVNNQTPNWGGTGFAQALRSRIPAVQADFKEWVEANPRSLRLGNVRIVSLDNGMSVASVIAQKGYGPSASPRLRYVALETGLEHVAEVALKLGAAVHMPRIGTGAGGGDWEIIEELIRQTLCQRDVKVTVYDLVTSSDEHTSNAQTTLPLGGSSVAT